MKRATPDELESFMKANADLEAVEAFITDPNGVARGKLLRASELAALFRSGRPLPGSILSMDITGMEVEQTGLIWDVGDADKLAFPVAGSLRRASWRSVPTAHVLLGLYEPDGTPHVADPRHVLASVVGRLEAAGYAAVVAAELEFYVVDPRRGADGLLQPPLTRHGRLHHIDGFSVTELGEFSPFLDELFAVARSMDLPAETAISEYGPGQLEIVLRHRADALRAADEAVQWKRVVRGVAAKHDLLATFMAKPFTGRAGSGLHIHASLDDDRGHNAFASPDPRGTPLMRHAIGGLLATLDESMGIFAPNASSYRRFQDASYAPISRTWGVNNRSVAVRVPTGAAETRHLEHRVAGADANPYLAIAAVLAGMHKGIVERIDPGPPVEGNGYGGPRLPNDWSDALRRMRASSFLETYFGARFVEIYHALKAAEYQRYNAQVTTLDLDWYLTRA
ncbi:MAG TPA: glutamine synthetase family protein [Kofleriaceae bacterium]|nr:glutamine synthetase family protein [Kofleriaceae bacterium]